MRKICLKNLQFLLLAVLVMAMTGCGANSITGSNGAPGSITAKMVWKNGTAKTLAATVPAGVASIQFTVTGTGANGAIPVVRSTVAASATSASVAGIYPGTVAVSVKALDSSNNTLYEGFAVNVNVAANATTDVGTINMQAPIVKAAEATCLGCHDTTLDETGQSVVANYKALSGHYTNTSFKDANGVGAGCVGCHGANHNIPNPFTSGRCFECHTDKISVHFNSYTSAGAHAAMFVSTNESCESCHQPHATKIGQDERKAYAKSAHGDVNGAAWASEDMQKPGQVACQRCHTGTGFKRFAIGNFQSFPTTSIGSAEDDKREVLGCDGCHSNNNFDVRQVGHFKAQYRFRNMTTTNFPDAGESNLCIACHSARENGVESVTDFTNASFKNSHYLPAAGLMYMSTGFTGFTSANAAIGTSTYGKSLTPDNTTVPGYGISGGVSSTHRKLGTSLINGDGHNLAVFVKGRLDQNGPCVTCHMNGFNAPAGDRAAHGHTLEIDSNAYNQVCVNCHTSENTVPLTGDNFLSFFVEPQGEAFQNSLNLAKSLLGSYGIEYDKNAYPYFFKKGLAHISANAVKNWTNGTGNQALGKKVMGACFNIQVLTKDEGAYAHARSYSRRLVYDTIDFLDDGVMNGSVGATALASGMKDASGNLIFTKGTQAYNAANGAITTPFTGTSEAMLYLIGWSRSTGAWTTPERP